MLSGATSKGGPAAVARALREAATRHGVDIRTGAAWPSGGREDDRAVGVVLASGEELEARAVISGVDPKRTFT